MPRFYFDVNDSKGFHPDEVGDDFADFEEAWDLCRALLPDIARDKILDGELHVIACSVRDEAGRTVYDGRWTFEGRKYPT